MCSSTIAIEMFFLRTINLEHWWLFRSSAISLMAGVKKTLLPQRRRSRSTLGKTIQPWLLVTAFQFSFSFSCPEGAMDDTTTVAIFNFPWFLWTVLSKSKPSLLLFSWGFKWLCSGSRWWMDGWNWHKWHLKTAMDITNETFSSWALSQTPDES